MNKKPFKTKSSVKKKDLNQEKLDMLEEKYQKVKEILKDVIKDLRNEKGKNEILQREYTKLENELKEKDYLLEKMQSVSEAVVDEFSTLKAKCEMETEEANKAIKRATKYFKENLKLKENQSKGQPELANISPGDDAIVLKEDSLYGDVSELEILNKSNSDLRTEIASLKIQLNKEIENQNLLKEDFKAAKLLYEQEVKEHKYILEKFKTLKMTYDRAFVQAEETNSLENDIDDKNNISQEDKIEDKSLECKDNSSKLKCKEAELMATIAAIEQQKDVLQNRIKDLKKQISHLKSSESLNESLCIPPPPPPPPPSFNPIKSLFTFIYAGRKATKKPIALAQESKESMENTDVHQKAMSEMINAIKKGSIHLKPVSKTVIEKEESIAEPIALVEMRNILKTLKKREGLEIGKAKETKNDDLSNNTSANVNLIYPKEVATNEPSSFHTENHTQFCFEKESIQLPHEENNSNRQSSPEIKVANALIPLPVENHTQSCFMNGTNKLPDQNCESHLDKDFPSTDNISNCSSSSLNGIEFPSYSSSILDDIKEDFIATI